MIPAAAGSDCEVCDGKLKFSVFDANAWWIWDSGGSGTATLRFNEEEIPLETSSEWNGAGWGEKFLTAPVEKKITLKDAVRFRLMVSPDSNGYPGNMGGMVMLKFPVCYTKFEIDGKTLELKKDEDEAHGFSGETFPISIQLTRVTKEKETERQKEGVYLIFYESEGPNGHPDGLIAFNLKVIAEVDQDPQCAE
jgi:hypothetical protein